MHLKLIIMKIKYMLLLDIYFMPCENPGIKEDIF